MPIIVYMSDDRGTYYRTIFIKLSDGFNVENNSSYRWNISHGFTKITQIVVRDSKDTKLGTYNVSLADPFIIDEAKRMSSTYAKFVQNFEQLLHDYEKSKIKRVHFRNVKM